VIQQKLLKQVVIVLISLILVGQVTGETHLDAHVHGEAKMMIVLENNQLFIEIETPAMNVLGYEHPPENKQQQQGLKQAVQTFEQSSQIIKLHGGFCLPHSQNVETPGLEHKADSPYHDHNAHTEFHISYIWTCKNARDLKEIELSLFEHFPGFDMIRAQWIFTRGQGAATLDSKHRLIKVK